MTIWKPQHWFHPKNSPTRSICQATLGGQPGRSEAPGILGCQWPGRCIGRLWRGVAGAVLRVFLHGEEAEVAAAGAAAGKTGVEEIQGDLGTFCDL